MSILNWHGKEEPMLHITLLINKTIVPGIVHNKKGQISENVPR